MEMKFVQHKEEYMTTYLNVQTDRIFSTKEKCGNYT